MDDSPKVKLVGGPYDGELVAAPQCDRLVLSYRPKMALGTDGFVAPEPWRHATYVKGADGAYHHEETP